MASTRSHTDACVLLFLFSTISIRTNHTLLAILHVFVGRILESESLFGAEEDDIAAADPQYLFPPQGALARCECEIAINLEQK